MTKLACIGDSITSGFTLLNPRRDSYPSLLQKMLGDGYEVRNFGDSMRAPLMLGKRLTRSAGTGIRRYSASGVSR